MAEVEELVSKADSENNEEPKLEPRKSLFHWEKERCRC